MDPTSATVLGGLGVVVGISAALCGRYAYKYSYWRRLGIPFTYPSPIIQSVWKHLGPDTAKREVKLHRTKGPIYGLFEDGKPVLSVADVDVVEDILRSSSKFFPNRKPVAYTDYISTNVVIHLTGERWKRVRSVISTTFSKPQIGKATVSMNIASQNLINNLKKVASDGKPVDMKRQFDGFVVDAILGSAFSSKTDSYNENNKFVLSARSIFNDDFSWKQVIANYPSLAKRLPSRFLPEDPLAYLKDFAWRMVKERIISETKFDDYLQLLLDANYRLEELKNEIKVSENKTKYLTYNEMMAQCILFFLAGFGTTSSTLSFTAYELAVNPDLQEKLIYEVDETIRTKGEFSQAGSGSLLHCVLLETVRKYSAIRTNRVADADYTIQPYNITVPKGMVVSVPIYAIHHDPKLYPDPEKYDPQRFARDMTRIKNTSTNLSFGLGPRQCIGQVFARTEMKTCLAHLMSQVRFCLSHKTERPKFNYAHDVVSPKEVKLLIEFRKDAVKL